MLLRLTVSAGPSGSLLVYHLGHFLVVVVVILRIEFTPFAVILSGLAYDTHTAYRFNFLLQVARTLLSKY